MIERSRSFFMSRCAFVRVRCLFASVPYCSAASRRLTLYFTISKMRMTPPFLRKNGGLPDVGQATVSSFPMAKMNLHLLYPVTVDTLRSMGKTFIRNAPGSKGSMELLIMAFNSSIRFLSLLSFAFQVLPTV